MQLKTTTVSTDRKQLKMAKPACRMTTCILNILGSHWCYFSKKVLVRIFFLEERFCLWKFIIILYDLNKSSYKSLYEVNKMAQLTNSFKIGDHNALALVVWYSSDMRKKNNGQGYESPDPKKTSNKNLMSNLCKTSFNSMQTQTYSYRGAACWHSNLT